MLERHEKAEPRQPFSIMDTEAKNISLKEKRNRRQRHQKSRNKIPYEWNGIVSQNMRKKFWS